MKTLERNYNFYFINEKLGLEWLSITFTYGLETSMKSGSFYSTIAALVKNTVQALGQVDFLFLIPFVWLSSAPIYDKHAEVKAYIVAHGSLAFILPAFENVHGYHSNS